MTDKSIADPQKCTFVVYLYKTPTDSTFRHQAFAGGGGKAAEGASVVG